MPYQYPYQTYQQYQPQYQPTYQPTYQPSYQPRLAGKQVNALEDIAVQDVPTDGSMALFPMADGSCVYGKRWTPEGNIMTVRYTADAKEQQPDRLQKIEDRISDLYALVEEVADTMPKRTTRRKANDE